MRWIFRILVVLVLFAILGVVGFAYLGDLSPDQSDVSEPGTLEAR